MTNQNFRGDFTVEQTFWRDGEQIAVPDHVIVEYFTAQRKGKFVVERNGDSCRCCSVSPDGMTLISCVALSRNEIGCGRLLRNVIEVTDDAPFPDGVRYVPCPEALDINLHTGKSDNTDAIADTVTLSAMQYGWSAYELAVQHGFDGTEEEWLESLKPQLLSEDEVLAAVDEGFGKTNGITVTCSRETELKVDGESYVIQGGTSFVPVNNGFSTANAIGLAISEIDTRDFDTDNFTDMKQMFYYCGALSLDVSGFDTSKVTNMYRVFCACKAQHLDVSAFDTRRAVTMSNMFFGCSKLRSLDLTNFDCSKTAAVNAMLEGCIVCTTLIGNHTLDDALGGLAILQGLGASITDQNRVNDLLYGCYNIGRKDIVALFNGLADITGRKDLKKGLTLKIAESYGVSAADIEIATNKGWTIAYY